MLDGHAAYRGKCPSCSADLLVEWAYRRFWIMPPPSLEIACQHKEERDRRDSFMPVRTVRLDLVI